jgi:hypothetical protein
LHYPCFQRSEGELQSPPRTGWPDSSHGNFPASQLNHSYIKTARRGRPSLKSRRESIVPFALLKTLEISLLHVPLSHNPHKNVIIKTDGNIDQIDGACCN